MIDLLIDLLLDCVELLKSKGQEDGTFLIRNSRKKKRFFVLRNLENRGYRAVGQGILYKNYIGCADKNICKQIGHSAPHTTGWFERQARQMSLIPSIEHCVHFYLVGIPWFISLLESGRASCKQEFYRLTRPALQIFFVKCTTLEANQNKYLRGNVHQSFCNSGSPSIHSSMIWKKKGHHFEIEKQGIYYFIDEGPYLLSLEHLVQHYSR